MKTRFIKYLFLVVFGFSTFSCADLEVENLTAPNTGDVLATPGDLLGLAGGAFRTWFNGVQEYSGPSMTMAVMADEHTCSWGNVAMKDMSSEPRVGFNNTITYSYAYVNRDFWIESYKALSSVKDVLEKIESGVVIDDAATTEMVKAWCYFVQGVGHGYLALIFDQAFILDETVDILEPLEFIGYPEVSAAALVYLDKAITTIDGTDDFTLPSGFINGYTPTSAELRMIASSYAVRILALTARNKADNLAISWNDVLSYAQDGLDYDFGPDTDGISWWASSTWIDGGYEYMNKSGWGRVDHRIINLMAEDYPSRWPDDNVSWTNPSGEDPLQASSLDDRLDSDFQYLADNGFRAERGYYHFSHYRYSRYEWWLSGNSMGHRPIFLKWENDMFIAEAFVRTGDRASAIDIINAATGARKVRGGLADAIITTDAEALDAIFYERDIELLSTQAGVGYFDMRRRDNLQRGTILHFPVPAAELEIIQAPWYTIAGAPDGINISDGEWYGKDGLVSPPN